MFDNTKQSNIINPVTIVSKTGKNCMNNQALLDLSKFTQIELTNKLIENLSNFSMLKKSSQSVLIRLTRYYNAQKEAAGKSSIYPSEQTLAINCNLSERTVKRAIKDLKDNNFILVIKGNKRFSVNHYKLTNIFFESLKMSPAKVQNVTHKGDILTPKQRKLTNKIKYIYKKNFKNSFRFKEIKEDILRYIKSMSDNIYYVIFVLFRTFLYFYTPCALFRLN